ncbi:DUF2975 domain-containing protein [Enterococcus wangshanyuanii]|uniref:DUF2975 domain-containing protein n=1 Tax=Enterococcus wangshanyuanii TaxID=2005703 RepID=A0ABQ1PU68_9ENTE|nr:DUF2975 domain-containing protein [Enterococcus wangshanyuanii]GGD03874.1 hypothetical protein GCM10011573_36700 [Enterococcus wangshanyuanii]
MNWTDKKSIKLSKWCLYLFSGMVVLTMVFISTVIDAIVPVDIVSPENRYLFVITLELCLGIGLVILFFLNHLISNIDNNETFAEGNIKTLRIISWFCFLESLILLISTTYYYPWLFVAGLTAFIGLIVRIIKNVFCQALLIKTENDYTI